METGCQQHKGNSEMANCLASLITERLGFSVAWVRAGGRVFSGI